MDWKVAGELLVPFVLALIPWMFSIHSKVAVLTEQTKQLNIKIDEILKSNNEIMEKNMFCEKKLKSHEDQIAVLTNYICKKSDVCDLY